MIKRNHRNQKQWFLYKITCVEPERIRKIVQEPFDSLYEAKYYAEHGKPLGYRPLTFYEKLKMIETGDHDVVSALRDYPDTN